MEETNLLSVVQGNLSGLAAVGGRRSLGFWILLGVPCCHLKVNMEAERGDFWGVPFRLHDFLFGRVRLGKNSSAMFRLILSELQ